MGPAVEAADKVEELIKAGMNVARLNLSHGSYEEHQLRFDRVRETSERLGMPVAILVDLQGPKIRLGKFADGPHELARGDIFTITTDDILGTKDRCSTTFKGLPGDCRPGDRLLIDDGKVAVEVVEVKGNDVVTKCIQPGFVSNNKGINLPGVAVSVPALSDKDEEDLRWGLRAGCDYIALSFVRNAADIVDVHRIMDEEGIRRPVVAKIEKPQAVDNLEEIVEAFDAIMVARGDLGVEMPIEEVPLVQKRCVTLAREKAKPVIVATQMLDSMITNSTPTRAEATDCANAVLDGADALMLSGETSVGAFPIETVQTMARIITRAEEEFIDRIAPIKHNPNSRAGAITKAAVEVATSLGAKFLIVFTQTGKSAHTMSRLRPNLPMLAFTPIPEVYRQLALSWGIEPIISESVTHTDEFALQVDKTLLPSGRINKGESVVIAAGSPPGVPGSTNALRVHEMGVAIEGAAPAYRN
jgi:pyruvate kinase